MKDNKTAQDMHDIVNSIGDGAILRIDDNLILYFLTTMVDMTFIDEIRKQYLDYESSFGSYFSSISTPMELHEVRNKLILGNIVSYHDNCIFLINGGIKLQERTVEIIQRELSFEGSLEALAENVDININLIRKYYNRPNLESKYYNVGTLSRTKAVILYDSQLVDIKLLKMVEEEVENINSPAIQSANELQQCMQKGHLLIPRMMGVYRPDRVVRALLKGKVVIFLNGTPSAIIAPATFHDHFTTVDDNYLFPIPSLFLMILRYTSLFITIIAPAMYIAITSFNPEVFRIQLALSITASRSGVAYPPFVEITLILLMMEFLIEASIRLPKTIGQTTTIVGGIILGQALTQSHLVSNVMVIIVATVAIANFMIPVTSLNLALRVMKYFSLLFASLMGLYGIYISLFAITCYSFSIYSFNTPFIDTFNLFNIKSIHAFFRREKI